VPIGELWTLAKNRELERLNAWVPDKLGYVATVEGVGGEKDRDWVRNLERTAISGCVQAAQQ
jgi:hypothetical protein